MMKCLVSWFLVAAAATIGAAANSRLDRRAPAQVFRKCTVNNTVALTFDDGPYSYLTDLVNLLNKEKVKATFFFNGNNWACIYNPPMVDAIKLAYQSGHQLASHTWSHKLLTNLTWDQLHDEMWRVEQAISRITGALPAFMRPPYGEYNDLVLEASGVRGQSVVIWDFDSEDGKAAPIERQRQLYDQAVAARPESILSIQHEVHATSVYEVLPYAIQKLKAANYTFVTVAECVGGLKPYYGKIVAPGIRNPDWRC